ncbi:MAG TPA: sodium:calcium antiporter [Candidatus Acetothermia bacterium]|nr:sodium:calcium antiporter [Candidatus Acetothermia bacterium]
MLTQWIIFLLCSLAIVLAGVRLAKFGDAIGRRSGIGQGWIGLLFLATITSVPELTTTVTGATIGAPNIAVGNALGSNLFNVAIIAIVDILLLGRGPFLSKVKSYHVVSGGAAILLTTLAAFAIAIFPQAQVLGISPFSLAILVLYVVAVFLLFRVERRDGDAEEENDDTLSLRKAIIGFAASAVVIVVAGIFLIHASKNIALNSALSGSFMGAILVAIVTSLPELSTSIGALRIGAYDMILGNLFGSNMFNILTIFFADVAFRQGSLFAGLGGQATNQLMIALLGIGITTIAVIGIAYRSKRKLLGMGVDAMFVLAMYLISTSMIVFRGIDF